MKIRELLSKRDLIVVPSVWDPLSVMMVEKAGFELIFTSGLAVAGSALGMPDMGLNNLFDIKYNAMNIRQVTDLPLFLDIDSCFVNDPKYVRKVVMELESIGVNGIQMEDQTDPPRSDMRKRVIPAEHFAKKIEAAVAARKDKDNLVIVGRTDAFALFRIVWNGRDYQKIEYVC